VLNSLQTRTSSFQGAAKSAHRGRLARALLCLCAAGSGAARAAAVTEADYFEPIPTVLTASRLDQPQKDAPGAVTVIDRATIRRSGARDVAELLRLVPGYLVSGATGAAPNAAYHVPQDEYGVRNLVLVDGRSVYSSFYLGDTQRGLMSVMPEDIERIEVLRGANSAAYGANAMFGVINIVTRHAFDSQGLELGLGAGSTDLRDSRFRVGWGDEAGSYRLSAGTRADSGYARAFDDRLLKMLDWRADLKPQPDDDLMLAAGTHEQRTGRGERGQVGDPERTTEYRDWYLQGRWQRQLSATGQLQLTADFADESYADASPYVLIPGVMLDYGAHGQRLNLELQRSDSLRADLRAVWGLGWKQEQAWSKALYNRADAVGFHEARAFGHLEWRPSERWTANAGAFAGDHSGSGSYLAPRLMLNHHFTPDQTLRVGVNRSVRSNSLLESSGDVRYYTPSGLLVGRAWLGDPAIRPEALHSEEISYLGHFRPLNLAADLRAYRERVSDWVTVVANPAYYLNKKDPSNPRQLFENVGAYAVRGVEYQLRWTPGADTRLQWQQNFSQLDWSDAARASSNQPPVRASTLAWFQSLPGRVDMTLLWYERGPMTWGGPAQQLPSMRRVDLRLAHPWRLERSKAEVALTVQGLNGDVVEGRPEYLLRRRAFLTLKLEQ
jgi:iron complex outermembrane receptor protein